MTWGRAIPVLIVCAVFDLARMFFEWFWFFGPALAAAACTAGVNSALETSVLAGLTGKMVAAGCTAAAGVAGFFGAGPIAAFGVVMAMAVGLFGWGTVTLILAITNPRIWQSNVWGWIWSIFALGISETPFLGTIPMLTITHLRLYTGQIKKDKAALKQYRKEQDKITAAMQTRERNQQAAHLMQAQAAEAAAADV